MRSSTRPNSLLLFLLAFSVTLWLSSLLNVALAQGVATPAEQGFAFGGDAGPATSLRDIFTDEVIIAGLFLVTAPLTSLLKRYVGTHDRATQIVNALVNAVLKGLLPLVAGIVTWPIALSLVIAGLIADRSWYAFLVQTSAKGVRVEEPVLATGTPTLSNSAFDAKRDRIG